MTLSATDRTIYQAVQTNRLLRRYPLRAKGENRRTLYVTPVVGNGLDGKDPAIAHLPMVQMELIIATFCAGYRLTVSLLGDPSKKPVMEKLEGLDEVWAVCARAPRWTQVRMFGRFADRGVFVGLQLHDRAVLGTRSNYNNAAALIPNVWGTIFGNVDPFRAKTASEYFGEQVLDVDQD